MKTGQIVLVVAAASVLAACSSTAAGTGSAATPLASVPSAARSSPPATSTALRSTAPSASASALSTAQITGSGPKPGTYDMTLWAQDVITDCGAHSYGQKIVDYFSAHPCRSATRRLWTFPLNSRTAVLSVISVSAQIGKINENPDFEYAVQLADLENADNTGSVNDLLREGNRVPGVATAIPAAEVFSVTTQDGLVVIMDGWYATATTSPSDAMLKNAEADLSLSDAAAPNS